ncbi:hypothetical protein N7512_003461 [Penicillium capsulatum]|nr:hypothetical protein N7512_003461 [Penicillium capsulatum]
MAVRRSLAFPMRTLRSSISAEGLTRIGWHLCRIAIAGSLLFLDIGILVAAAVLNRSGWNTNRRLTTQRNVQFYPKTILITGIGTAQGLHLARAWDAEGHRVVGADVTDLDLPVRSGGSMSRTLIAFYRVPKDHYISRVLDIVHREKVDLWIPCSPKATAMEDTTAQQVIESRTNCKCIAFDTELTKCFTNTTSFRQYLADRNLPVVACHRVQSRDSIHKILHRSPSKSYQIRRLSSGEDEAVIVLPKRTLSRTYSEVSEIQISKDSPWVLQQQTRLGEFFADLLVVRGYVYAIKVRLADARSLCWGASRVDESLAMSIHRVMQSFATHGGPRMTGHLSVRLLVDEEFDNASVRHTIHIADCVPGSAAVENLLRNARCPIDGYLAALSREPAVPADDEIAATLCPAQSSLAWVENQMVFDLFARFLSLGRVRQVVVSLQAELIPFVFWRNPHFSYRDPLPWWWHVHVYQPLREIWMLMKQTRSAGLTKSLGR